MLAAHDGSAERVRSAPASLRGFHARTPAKAAAAPIAPARKIHYGPAPMITHRISATLPVKQNDLAAGAFYAAGFSTVLVQEPGDLGTADDPVAAGKVRLVGYLEEGDDAAQRLDVLRRLLGPKAPLRFEPFTDENWLLKFRAHHRAVRIGADLVIAPPWSKVADKKGRVILRIDPGLAFGTGSHASTHLCLRALQDLARKGALGRVLDVGTGSGVLAFAALRLGAKSARGIEPDLDALGSAQDNARLNGLRRGLRLTAETAADVAGRYDLVLANLVRDLLLDTAAALSARVAPGGVLVLAGLLDTQADDVRAAFEAQGLRLLRHRRREGWSALELEKPLKTAQAVKSYKTVESAKAIKSAKASKAATSLQGRESPRAGQKGKGRKK